MRSNPKWRRILFRSNPKWRLNKGKQRQYKVKTNLLNENMQLEQENNDKRLKLKLLNVFTLKK